MGTLVDIHSRLTQAIMGDANHLGMPLIGGRKVVYEFGDESHLNQILKLYDKNRKELYPLIYNVNSESNQDSSRSLGEVDLKLVIATRNLHTEYKNTQRWATSYRNVLFPVAKNLVTLFTKGSIFIWNETFNLKEFPNFGEAGENETTDIWDALRFDTTIKINNHCLQKAIKY